MATNKKNAGHVRSMIIGAFTVFGILILVWAIFFFNPSVGDNKNKLAIKFSNIEGITRGTRVTFAGMPVGEVVSIKLINNSRNIRPDSFGNPYSYEVIVKLDSEIQVYNTDEIEIRTSGLLGEKSIAIIPQPVKPGEQVKSVVGGTIYANSEDPLSSALKTVQEASVEIARTMNNVSEILESNQELIHDSMQTLNETLQDVSDMVFEAKQMNIVGNINQAAINFNQVMKNANQLLENVNSTNVVQKLDLTLDNLTQITENISNGKGTLGKLVNDPSLYLGAISMIDRVNQLIYDLNHYGLLFHRNRQWKEQQRERLAQMEELKSPNAFTEAFETEMKQINQSLDKVTEMLDQAEMGNEEAIRSEEFKNYFYNLLQEVNRLQYLIELYNQKVSDPKARN